MQLFVGLGNPGPKHARQRHNIGFMALDAIAERHGAGPWRAKFQGQLAEARLRGEKVWLLKPETFMNLSGHSVGAAAKFYGLAAEDVTVFHDELDLAPGKMRVKRGGGHAGHNGLRSIHQAIGESYRRVRLGIGHPGHKDKVSGHVLHDFSKAETAWLEPLLDEIARAAETLAAGDDAGFTSEVMRHLAPPKPAKEKPAAAKPSAKPAPQDPAPEPSLLERLQRHFSRD